MRLRFLILCLVAFVLATGTGYAQTFTGTIDGYFTLNRNTPIDPSPDRMLNNCGMGTGPCFDPTGDRFNNFRAFDYRDRAFSLNYGEIAVEYKPNDVGIRVDIGFGDAADVVHSFEPAGLDEWRHIQQAYITATKNNVTLDFGKFVTPIGAEVIETKDNWNYSRGLLFTWAIPFYHFGARATMAVNDNVSFGGYLVNGWNNVKDNNSAKSIGLTGSGKPHEKITVVGNFLWGHEDPQISTARELYDAIVTIEASERLTLMANYDYGRDTFVNNSGFVPTKGPRAHWQGIAGYVRYKVGDSVTLSTRYEWFDDHDGFMTGSRRALQSATGTAIFPWNDLNFWLEYRRDWSNDETAFLATQAGTFTPTPTIRGDQTTFTVGLTYTFEKSVN